MRVLGRDQKRLNINSAELFSPPVLLPGTASQVQGSRRSPVECSVSITGTSHGAVTRETAGHPLSLAPATATHSRVRTGKHTQVISCSYTPAAATTVQSEDDFHSSNQKHVNKAHEDNLLHKKFL